MHNMFHSHKSMIDAWPDLHAFAVDIEVTYDAAKQMRRRDSIGAEYWTAAVSGAKQRMIEGVTYEALAEIAAAKRRATKSEMTAEVAVSAVLARAESA